jgi:hypothetical protein
VDIEKQAVDARGHRGSRQQRNELGHFDKLSEGMETRPVLTEKLSARF